MSWDRKKRGAASGYYYKSVRLADKPHPVKVYFGRRTAGHLAAADVEHRRRDREVAKAAVRAERETTAEADRLADELRAWAAVLSKVWLGLSGCHNRKGSWRVKRGRNA
jgi:hypothetical protein